MLASERLQLSLLIGADHVLVWAQALALERAGIQIQHPAGLLGKVGVAREDPGAGLPRLDRVLMQPPPDRRGRRLRHPALDHQAVQLNPGETRERQLVGARQLARDRLDLGDLFRGGSGAGAPRVSCRSTPRSAPRRSVFATGRRAPAASATGCRSRHCSVPQPRAARASPAEPPGADANSKPRDAPTRAAPHRSTRSDTGCAPAITTRIRAAIHNSFNPNRNYGDDH